MVVPSIPPTPSDVSIAGKTALITGGNTGLGFETARQFLILNASRVIITVRSKAKGEEAVKALCDDPEVKKTNPDAHIEAFELELDDYQSILSFCNKVKKEVKELDIFLNNAGIFLVHPQVSKSGHHTMMQVNCYSQFLLSLELLPLLRSTAAIRGSPSRLTFVTSSSQSSNSLVGKPIPPEASIIEVFDNARGPTEPYNNSKLVVSAFVRGLATMVPCSEVIVNNLCPGSTATNLSRNLPLWLKPIVYIMNLPSVRTVQTGARTLIYASVVADQDSHGKFFDHNKIEPGAAILNGDTGTQFINKLWDEIVEEAAKVDPALGAWRLNK